jgi:uncharacterized protein (DUF2141 family)
MKTLLRNILKNINLVLLLTLILSNQVFAQENATTQLKVIIKDVESLDGVIYLAICSKENFNIKNNVEKCIASATQQINGSEQYTIMFNDIPQGVWAIFGYIDENKNNILETNNMEIPTEPVLFVKKLKGFPEFDYIKSQLNQKEQTIILIAQ